MKQSNIIVTEREGERGKAKNVFKKFLPYTAFNLNDLGIDVPEPKESERTLESPDGDKETYISYVYEDERLQFAQDCLAARVENNARSKDKAGDTPAMTVEELLEGGTGTRYGTQVKEFKAAFAAWINSTKASEQQKQALIANMDDKRLINANPKTKAAMGKTLQKFLDTVGESANDYASVIRKLEESINTEVDLEDFDPDALG